MKKITESLGEQLQPVKLYLDDIDSLFQILSEVSTEVKIETSEHQFQNTSDLKKLDKESIHVFKLYCHNPYISLDINKRSTIWLFTDKDLPAQRGTFEKLKKKLIQKKRYSVPTIIYPILFILILNAFFYLVLSYIEKPLEHFLILGLAVLIISYLIGYLTYQIYLNKRSIIFLDKKIDSPNFWKRNKDRIIIAVSSSIVGAIAGALITFLLVQS